MKKLINSLLIGLALVASPVMAHEFKIGDIEIIHPNSRAMVPGAKVGGGYLKIINQGKTDDRLLSIQSPRANDVQLHEMIMDKDIMKMREVRDGIPVPAGATVELNRGGLHIMFMQVQEPFKEGDKFDATLTFEKAGTVDVQFLVEAAKGEDKKSDHSEVHEHQHGDKPAPTTK